MASDWPPADEEPFDFDTGERPAVSGGPPRFDPERIKPHPDDPYSLDTGEARIAASERGDPFDTGEFRRRRRAARRGRRDLPAKIRRRQAVAVLCLIALVGLGGYLLISGGGGDAEDEQPFPLRKLVGQSVITTMGEDGVDRRLLRRVQRGWVGGVLVVSGDEGQLRDDVLRLRRAALRGGNPPPLIVVDQEGGIVKRLPGPPDRSPAEIREEGESAATEEGEKTGDYLRDLGVNVDLAPVLDVAHAQTEETIAARTYGEDAEEVGALGAAFITALQSRGVAATAKHFPALGLAAQNTDFEPVTVAASTTQLRADMVPFRAAVEAGVDLVMVSTAVFPGLSGRNPAAFSPNVIQNELRQELGFEGVVVADDLETPGARTGPANAAVRAIRAGVDLALFASTEDAAIRAHTALVKAVRDGTIDRAVAQAAYDRVVALKDELSGNGLGSEGG